MKLVFVCTLLLRYKSQKKRDKKGRKHPQNPHCITKGESCFVRFGGIHFHMKREVLSNPFIHVRLVC